MLCNIVYVMGVQRGSLSPRLPPLDEWLGPPPLPRAIPLAEGRAFRKSGFLYCCSPLFWCLGGSVAFRVLIWSKYCFSLLENAGPNKLGEASANSESSCTNGTKFILMDDTNLSLLRCEIRALVFPSNSTAVDDASFTSSTDIPSPYSSMVVKGAIQISVAWLTLCPRSWLLV